MNKYDMGDLIIEDEDKREKKPKKILAIIALVIIILLAGMMIMKSFIGGDSDKKSEFKKSKNIDKELEPVKSPIKMTKKGSNDDEDELKPISDDELPSLPMPKEDKKSDSHSDSSSDTIAMPPIHHDSYKTKEVEESKPQPKKEEKREIVSRPKHTKTVKHHAKPKNTSKPSELFKHSSSKSSSSKKIYYVQVGSFGRAPTKDYLNNIKSKGYHYKFFKSGNLIKVRIGPYGSYNEAKVKMSEIKSALGLDGFVVKVK